MRHAIATPVRSKPASDDPAQSSPAERACFGRRTNRSRGVRNRYTLNAGQTIFLGVNNNGEYSYDSTGLTGSITAVPEPATWAMMIGGFGMVGGAMRYRRRKTQVAYAAA